MNESTVYVGDVKVCTDCGKGKYIDSFYKRSGKPHLRLSVCKTCMKERALKQVGVPLTVSTIPHEQELIDKLLRMGIPALPGKALAHKYADVIAWGCVMIEVKLATFDGRSYVWHFTPQQQERGVRGHLIVLVAYNHGNRYYVFSADDDVFYRDGQLKTGVSWTPNRNGNGREAALTDVKMALAEHCGAHIGVHIESERIRISDGLRNGIGLDYDGGSEGQKRA